MEYVHHPCSNKMHRTHVKQSAPTVPRCSYVNLGSRAGLTSFIPVTVDTASRLTLTNAVRKQMNFALFSVAHSSPPTVCGACKTGNLVPLFATRTPQKPKNSSSGKMATTQPRGMSCTALRTPAWMLMKLSDSPLRGPDLCISVPTDSDNTSDFLDDLTAAVQGIRI